MAEAPGCTMEITGKCFDVFALASTEPDSSGLVLIPHKTAYKTDSAFENFCAYLKTVAMEGGVDALDLIRHWKSTEVVLCLVHTRLYFIDGVYFKRFEQVMKTPSEAIYNKVELLLPKAKALASLADVEALHLQGTKPVEPTSAMVVMATGKGPATPEPARKDPSERKPMMITTVTQGSQAQDSMAETLKAMTAQLGVKMGQAGGGIKQAMILSPRKAGVVALTLDQMTDDEITERDSMALAGGGTPAPAKSQAERTTHIPMPTPRTAAAQAQQAALPQEVEGEDDGGDFFGDLNEGSDVAEAAIPARTSGPIVDPRGTKPKPSIAVISGDQAERQLSAGALSADSQLALQYQQHEGEAADTVGDLTEGFFMNRSRVGAETGDLAEQLAGDTQEINHGGRRVQKTGVSGAGRGNKAERPASTRPKVQR